MAVILGNPIMLGGGGGSKVKKMAIEKLTEGTIVRIKEKGVLTDYYLAQHDYQPSLNGSGRVLFVRKELYNKVTPWNSAGVNTYANSDVDQILNTEVLSLFDADVREAIGETTFPYTVGDTNDNVSSLRRSLFLPSFAELGLSFSYNGKVQVNAEGTKIPIADSIKVGYLNGAPTSYWVRTPLKKSTWGSNNAVGLVNADGTSAYTHCQAGTAVFPVWLTLPNTATVLPEANLDGSYTLSLGDDDPTKEYFKLTVVDGTEKPENPAENTIWVNTDVDMGMCYLAPNAPASPEVGDVWVNTTNKYNSNGTNASTKLIRVNDNPYLEINVLNISQWDGSAWVTRENSAIYANGAWTTMALWLYNYGSMTDGFPMVFSYSAGSGDVLNKNANGHITYESERIYLYSSSGSMINRVIQCETPIDFGKYTKMKMVLSRTGTVGASIRAGKTNGYIGNGSFSVNAILSECVYLGNLGTTATTLEVDLLGVSGTGYATIEFDVTSNPHTNNLYIHQWCLTA